VAEHEHTALNQSVVFVKETDLLLTRDHWNIVINFNLTPGVVTVATLKEDLLVLKEVEESTKIYWGASSRGGSPDNPGE
jgi:hypothetical protein